MNFTIEQNRLKAKTGYGQLDVSPDESAGYRPYELFISSLAGCSGTILRNILHKKRFLYEKLEIEAASERNQERANRIEKITLTAHVYSDHSLNKEQADKIAELTVKNCGMIQSVIDAIQIQFIVETLPV